MVYTRTSELFQNSDSKRVFSTLYLYIYLYRGKFSEPRVDLATVKFYFDNT